MGSTKSLYGFPKGKTLCPFHVLWFMLSENVTVLARVWSSIRCGQRGGRLKVQVIRDDSHLCLITGSLLMSLCAFTVSRYPWERDRVWYCLAKLVRHTPPPNTHTPRSMNLFPVIVLFFLGFFLFLKYVETRRLYKHKPVAVLKFSLSPESSSTPSHSRVLQ